MGVLLEGTFESFVLLFVCLFVIESSVVQVGFELKTFVVSQLVRNIAV